MLNDRYKNRKFAIAAIFVVVIFIYICSLFFIQVIETKYKEGAISNALLNKTLYPPRGFVYDRNNELLVYNQLAYDLALIMNEVRGLDTLDLCQTLKITKEEFEERITRIKDRKKNRAYSPHTPQVFLMQLEPEEVAEFQQKNYKFPGFYIQNRSLREYSYPNSFHVLGSVGEVSRRQLDADSYYSSGDYVGREGVELVYEDKLRGEKGVEVLLRDSRGRIKGRYENGSKDLLPKSGEDISLGLDVKLQELGERLLSGKIGAIVAIEPSSGEILSLVSSPTVNPALLVGKSRSQHYSELLKDETKPLLNHATQAQYSPGSTFKVVQALVCLSMQGIKKNTLFTCAGRESRPIRCTHSHKSPLNIYDAIEQSCNPYFWQMFRNTLEKDAYGENNKEFKKNYNLWLTKVRSFGLGQKFSNTDVYEQLGGSLPAEEFFSKRYGANSWRALTIRSLSIGQGEVLVTPLQLANIAAIIANDGSYIAPHFIKKGGEENKRYQTEIEKEYFPIVKEGMRRVCENTSSGIANRIEGLTMAGKTGTVQNPHGEDHSLFIGFAPFDDPKIAIAVVVENAGFGARWALPMASLMIEQYLLGDVKRKKQVEKIENTVINQDVKKH